MAPQAPPAPAAAQHGGQAQVQIAPWPFPVGVFDTQNASDYQETKTMTTGTVKFPDVKVEPDGWLRGLWFEFDYVVATNTNTIAFAGEDSPFDAIDTVLFRDTGGEQIFGPVGGYDWMTANKFGAYHAQGDPRADQSYSVTTGSVAASGSFHFCLYLPLEISASDALGDVQNISENSIYRVELTMAASATVFSQAPGTLGAMTVTTVQDSYTEPNAAMALSGRPVSSGPPSPGLLQYWKTEDDSSIPASSHSTLITNGISNGYRCIILKLTDASSPPSREAGEDNWPSPLEITLGTQRLRNLYQNTWLDKMGRDYQSTSVTRDVAGGLEAGVYVVGFHKDTGIKPGNESRRKYLRTKSGNTFKIRGTYGGAGTLWIFSNYVVPKDNNFSTIVA